MYARISAEAVACFEAAGLDFATADELGRRAEAVCELPVGGAARGGGSTWQSLSRRTGTVETDYLNGEIARLGERYGVPAPLNRALSALARRAAIEGWAPGRLTTAELGAALEAPG
jgi:2-dehydropantoate 2-reductase